jgi:hypothetical protein
MYGTLRPLVPDRQAQAVPATATVTERTRTAKVVKILPSADAWHSPTNAIHFARSVASVVAGSGPAPMEPGSKNATIDDSEDFPGPQVPPTAGLGRATNAPVIAKAAPKRPTNTKINLNPTRDAGSITCDLLSAECR